MALRVRVSVDVRARVRGKVDFRYSVRVVVMTRG